jgi:mono/diheme cytochrome c family protein
MARVPVFVLALAALAAVLSACGTAKIEVPTSDTAAHKGAEVFAQRCAGCHTFKYAGTHGSASNIRTAERTDGPNFNVRPETMSRVLYAIHNGGFSGAIMPQNIVVGPDADAVAAFVSKYAGREAVQQPGPSQGGGNQSVRGTTPPRSQPSGGSTGTKPATSGSGG